LREDSLAYHHRILRRTVAALLLVLAAMATAPAADAALPFEPPEQSVELIVEVAPAPAARAGWGRPDSTARVSAAIAAVRRAQAAVERQLHLRIPSAEVTWRYELVLAGLAVVVPAGAVAELEHVPGVVRVYPTVRYHPLLDTTPEVIGAPELWGPGLENAGQGMRIGIIDDGIDQSHQFFSPAGLTPPPGFPKGDPAYTSAKVIVARAFPPPDAGWRNAGKPFDPVNSFHGTHVAGIAAGVHGTPAGQGIELSGVAPRAFLGNYKALTVPTESGFGLNGNSPELVAAIEAAVADGMDVINLSLGEPEVEPSRDAVAQALDNAAAAGVVPVVAAGNDFDLLGRGSVGSPGTASRAITVAAVDDAAVLADFSSSGPTPFDLAMKPDVAAPGVDVLSAQPDGRFDYLSGTSMATPHVAGAAALLLELHPDWSVEQLKSALVSTGRSVRLAEDDPDDAETTRSGGGLIDLPEAADPDVFTSPQGLAFGLLDVNGGAVTTSATVELFDAGGGAGSWSASLELDGASGEITVPSSVTVPGQLLVSVSIPAGADEGERTGFVLLERSGELRRIPFWYRVTRPRLAAATVTTLPGQGTYSGDTAGLPAAVSRYRYPDAPAIASSTLAGPEQVFQITVTEPVANLGVAVVGSARHVSVEPRILRAADENRLAGAAALPYVGNPYLTTFLRRTTAAAVLLPAPGTYSIVFDTPGVPQAGTFRFRVWIDDRTPPTVRLLGRRTDDGRLRARVADVGAGVDPRSIVYRVDGGRWRRGRLASSVATLDVSFADAGNHRLTLRVGDRQEVKNNENVPGVLPNTRELRTTFTVAG
jgi:subtilisin family serine protease